MKFIIEMLSRLREELRAAITMRLGVLIISLIFAVLGSGLAAVATIGRGYASRFAITLVNPALVAVHEKQAATDMTVATLVTANQELFKIVRQQGILSEKVIAAQRRADPRFDRALKEQIVAGEKQQQIEKENRELVKRLIGPNP